MVFAASIDWSTLSEMVDGAAEVRVTAGSTVRGPTPYSAVASLQTGELAKSCRNPCTSAAPLSPAYRMGRTLGAVKTGPPSVTTRGRPG